jgi:hypothetical protein
VNVPSSIDATGSTDVTSALASFINNVPNGSVISFPPNANYRLTSGIHLRGRNNLVLAGNGTTLKLTGGGTSTAHSGFKLDALNADIAIRNFRIVGANPNTTTLYNPGAEFAPGVFIGDSQRVEIDRVAVSHVYGDGVYIVGKNTSPYRPSEDVWVHHSSFDYIGRMGVVPNAVRGAVIERNTFNRVGLILVDIEPNHSWEVVDRVYFRDNQVGSYSLSGHQTNWFFAAAAAPGTVSNVYVERNHVSVGASVNANNPAGKGGLATRADRASRLRNLVFRDNTTTVAGKPVNGYPGILYFAHIDGLTVTGNVQPVISGALTAIRDSTGVVVQP